MLVRSKHYFDGNTRAERSWSILTETQITPIRVWVLHFSFFGKLSALKMWRCEEISNLVATIKMQFFTLLIYTAWGWKLNKSLNYCNIFNLFLGLHGRLCLQLSWKIIVSLLWLSMGITTRDVLNLLDMNKKFTYLLRNCRWRRNIYPNFAQKFKCEVIASYWCSLVISQMLLNAYQLKIYFWKLSYYSVVEKLP